MRIKQSGLELFHTKSSTVNGGTILFKNGISIHVAEDGFVKTVIGRAKVKSTWEVLN